MKLPGFSAESSLGRSRTVYFAKNAYGSSGTAEAFRGTVLPARRRQQSCSTKYGAFISHHFPVTVCKPIIGDLSTVATLGKTGASGVDRTSTSSGVKSLKSSALGLARFRPWQDCRVITLPFIADVTVTQSCEDSNPDSSVLEVYGHPELSTSWTGGIDKLPPQFNPNWFSLTGHSCSCCDQTCFDGRCVPHGVSCDIHPA